MSSVHLKTDGIVFSLLTQIILGLYFQPIQAFYGIHVPISPIIYHVIPSSSEIFHQVF